MIVRDPISAIFRGGPLDGHHKTMNADVQSVVMRTRFSPESTWRLGGVQLMDSVQCGHYTRGEKTIHGVEFNHVRE